MTVFALYGQSPSGSEAVGTILTVVLVAVVVGVVVWFVWGRRRG